MRKPFRSRNQKSIIIVKRILRFPLFLLWLKRRGLLLIWLKKMKTRLLSRFGILQLERLFICPSHECNANCVHCFEKFDHENFQKSLTTKQIKDLIDQFHQMGGSLVRFCSGEFLLRNDALDLVRYVYSKNIGVSVTTNGLLLDERTIDELKIAGLTELMVSIDSANPTRHDELRGVQGCFEKAVNGIRIAKKKGIITRIWTYASKTNFNELDGVVKLGKELGVFVYAFFPLLSGRLFNKFEENLTYEEREVFRKQFNNKPGVLLEFPTEESPCRGGGFEHIAVMPSGDVTFCPVIPYSYGNINSRSLKDCLKDIVKDYKRFSHCTGQCPVNFPEYRQNCNAKFIYG